MRGGGVAFQSHSVPAARNTIPATELERVFAILRFISQQEREISPILNNNIQNVNKTTKEGVKDATKITQEIIQKNSKDENNNNNNNRNKSMSSSSLISLNISEEITKPLEQFRMAVTNFPIQMENIQSTRAILHTTLLQVYPNHTEEVNKLFASDAFVEEEENSRLIISSSTSQHPQQQATFMRNNNLYALQTMNEILPGLYVGSYHPAADKANLIRHHISHILCCIDVAPRFPTDFIYMTLPAQDAPGYNIAKFFSKTFHFIESALMKNNNNNNNKKKENEINNNNNNNNMPGGVLVHCGAGISRAPTITAAYLMRKLNLTAAIAIQIIQRRRRVASPNSGFRLQLKKYQEELGIV